MFSVHKGKSPTRHTQLVDLDMGGERYKKTEKKKGKSISLLTACHDGGGMENETMDINCMFHSLVKCVFNICSATRSTACVNFT